MFWKRKSSEQSPSPAQQPVLESIRIFTPTSVFDAWLHPPPGRLSDLLNAADELSLSRVSEPTESDWFVIDRDQALMIAPPPQTGGRDRRLHRVKRPVNVVRGPYLVKARVHMIAGIDLDPHLARSGRHFLPVTDAWVTSPERREIDEHLAELLINVRSTIGRLELEVIE